MHRAEALQPLSHDHHQALFIAMTMRRADAATVSDAASTFLAFWEADGRRHFREEEEILLPAYAPHGDIEHPLVARALVEHVGIRAQAAALARSMPVPDVDRVRALGTALNDHVRLEERQLFPLIEAALPPEALAALAAELDHGDRPRKQ